MNIDDIAPILNRSPYEIKCKLTELKINIPANNQVDILKHLSDITYDLEKRINSIKK